MMATRSSCIRFHSIQFTGPSWSLYVVGSLNNSKKAMVLCPAKCRAAVRQKVYVSCWDVSYIGSWNSPVVRLPMECQSRSMYISRSVHHSTAWSSSFKYSTGVRSRRGGGGGAGVPLFFAPPPFLLERWSLPRPPLPALLAGKQGAPPREK